MYTLLTSFLHAAAAFKMSILGMAHAEAREHRSSLVGACTALAKFCATLATYPLIRAKVLQQTGSLQSQFNVLGILRKVAQTEGMRGLYRGVWAMSYKAALWNFVMMASKTSVGPPREVTPETTPVASRLASKTSVNSLTGS